MLKEEMELKTLDELEKVSGGLLVKNPDGSVETDDKYLIVDDNTKQVIAKTGGYRHARKIAEKMDLSVDFMDSNEVLPH